MSTSRSRRLGSATLVHRATSASLIRRLLGVAGRQDSVETLERRELLSGAELLPEGSSWTRWGGQDVVAATGSYVVTFTEDLGRDNAALRAQDVANALGITAWGFEGIARGKWAKFNTTATISASSVQALMQDFTLVSWVEPDRLYKPARTPNDPEYTNQWWARNVGQAVGGIAGTPGADINVEGAWDISIGSRDVVVGIIDTGVDYNHPDLEPNIFINPNEIAGDNIDNDGNGYVDDIRGFDFADQDNDPMDFNFGFDEFTGGFPESYPHGTPVAGLVGAAGNNGQGTTGVNWRVSLLPLKIANSFGQLTTSAIVAAHDYCSDLLARGINVAVTNNSYGAYRPQTYDDQPAGFNAERTAIERYITAGGIFVAAAGNESTNVDAEPFAAFPAAYSIPGIISVAALDENGDVAGFSNFGATRVQLAAPGSDRIYTTRSNGATPGGSLEPDFNGTSAASPIVAGAAALLKSIKPTASAVEIREVLINTSTPIPSLAGKVQSGGIINVTAAAQALLNDGPRVRGFTPGPVTTNIDPATGLPLRSVAVSFSEAIATTNLNPSAVELRSDGPNNVFGDSDDVVLSIASVVRSASNDRQVTVTATTAQFAEENYRLTLFNSNFRDLAGNRLNGNATGGTDAVLNFRVSNTGGALEENNTIPTATPVNFDASGAAVFNSLLIGDGIQTVRDVDLFRVNVPGPGQITAEVTARRLPGGSSLDSVVRLFDVAGNELARNDQFFGQDSYVDFFVSSGGSYFVGVSGFGNADYNPLVTGSGTTQSLGQYNIRFTNRSSTPDVVGFNATNNSVPGQPAFPRPVPPTGLTRGTTTAAITVADTRQILDVNVSVNLRHPNISDMEIELIAPNGTTARLFTQRGGTGDDLGTRNSSGQPVLYTTFDDEQTQSIALGSAPFAGNFRPEENLSRFDGLSGAGTWTLRLADIRDLNAGSLIDWNLEFRFQNDIFGPFEANDTIALATPLTGITGTGSATATAFLGDGGFGNLDRDLFRFSASPGSTLTATVVPAATGTLDSALRLFDTNGTPILLSNPSGRRDATISNYVFSNGGTFYLGVSESQNLGYNPVSVGGGTAATTTGSYTLTVNVTPGVSDSSSTAIGDPLSFGLRDNGVLGDPTTGVGLERNNLDFLPRVNGAVPRSFFGLTVDGTGFLNSESQTQIPAAVNNQSDLRNNRIQTITQFRGVKLERTLTSGLNDGFVAVDISLTNTTGGILNNLAFAEGFNPDPGAQEDERTQTTTNDVIRNGRVAVARFSNNLFLDGTFIALAAPDASGAFGSPKATVLPGTTTVRDASILVSQAANDPNGAAPQDDQLAMSYFIQNLAAGSTVSFRYFILTAFSADDLTSQLNTLNSSTGGTGHFTFNPASPASEVVGGANVPTYSYRVYYPEGFLGPNIFTFLPISNPNDQPVRINVIQRFEGVDAAFKDRVVPAVDSEASAVGATLVIPARSRKGVDLNTPELFNSGAFNPAVRFRPYAVEIRSDRPIAATFSYYDLVQISSGPVAVGEAFTSVTSSTWTFGDVQQRGTENFSSGINSYIVLQNPQLAPAQVTARVFDADLGVTFRTTRVVGAEGRAGIYLGTGAGASPDLLFDLESTTAEEAGTLESLIRAEYQRRGVPESQIQARLNSDRRYSVQVTSDQAIVAAKSTYNPLQRQATGTVGNQSNGSLSGILAEGQFGLRNTGETIGILNTNAQQASVLLSFLFQNGTTARQTVSVPAGRSTNFQVSTIANFPTGQPYSVFFESNVPVSLGATVPVQQGNVSDAFSVTGATQAYTFWGFGEGFRPGDNSDWNPAPGIQRHPGLSENLRIYNPSTGDVTIEITFNFDLEPGTETFRRTISGRRVAEFNIDQFITGNRRQTNQSYGIFVKSSVPIVAEMNRYDLLFPGGFATLGTPLGRTAAIS